MSDKRPATATEVQAPVKRGRGRPPKKPQQGFTGNLRQQSLIVSTNDEEGNDDGGGYRVNPLTAEDRRRLGLDDTDDEEENSEDRVMDEFIIDDSQVAASVPVKTIPRPDFGDKKHMWFQTTQVQHMATIFKCLASLLTSAEIIFFPTGWRVMAVNSKKTAMIHLRVNENTLMEGNYESTSSYRVSIPLEEMSHCIRMCRKASVMSMTLEGDPAVARPDNLRLDFSSGQLDYDMLLQLRSPEEDHPTLPGVTYCNQVDLPADRFKEVIHSIKGYTLIRNITFTKYKNKFTMSAESKTGPINVHFVSDNTADSARFFQRTDQGMAEIPAANGNEVAVDGEEEKPLSASFSLAEITGFTTITRASKWVRINMPEPVEVEDEDGNKIVIDTPLKMSYSLAALGEISFYLASKVPDNE